MNIKHKTYGLETPTGIVIDKEFSSYEEARDWGYKNLEGKKTPPYKVIIMQKKYKSPCICYLGNDKTKELIWVCKVHGNVWNGVRLPKKSVSANKLLE
jgi:hypothetical protein